VPGGTREVPVPRLLRAHPALDDAQVGELARLALDLELVFVHPVDIEAAFAGGDLYLLQCRPVTTLGEARLAAD
jgi:pyruvate,water dikinase